MNMNNNTTSCVIYFNEQATIFMNEFASTIGQIMAVAVSSFAVVPLFNFYKTKLKMN